MLCQRCKKNTATLHLTDILKSGERREKHLCDECAVEEGVAIKPTSAPLNEILTKFVMHQSGLREQADLVCPECSLSFVEFRQQGLLGCPHDYEAFASVLDPLIQQAHEGAVQHIGKIPSRADRTLQARTRLLRLRRELEAAIEREDYETAARLRDEIREAEGQ